VGGPGTAAPTGTVSFLDSTYGGAVLGTAALKANTAGLSWAELPAQTTGYYAHSEVTADLNGDGIPDLAILSDNGVVVLLGNGDGTFTPATGSPIAVGSNDSDTTSIAVGNFNNDGHPDLVVTNINWTDSGEQGTVILLLGKGDGTFTAAAKSPFAAGGSAQFAAVGDFNGDGNADLAVVNGYGGNGVILLLGNGAGGFTKASSSTTVGNNPIYAVAGDFNGDSKTDLAVANQYDSTISILLGNGSGGFTAASGSPISVGNSPNSIAVGDLNGDGKLDLAVANAGGSSVSILQGNGDGTFTAAANSPITLNSSPESIAIGDFNGDGIADLAATLNGYPGAIAILLGRGQGTFTQPGNSPVAAGDGTYSLAVADFNGDGIADLAVTNENSTTEGVLLTTAQASTATVTGISVAGMGPHQAVVSYPGNSVFNSGTSAPAALYAPTPTPTISLKSGTYTGTQLVKVTDTAAKTTIYYTTDGSTPGTWSTQYMGVIKVTSSETVQAIAVATGYAASTAATATYTIK
jgi:hypothetical protein